MKLCWTLGNLLSHKEKLLVNFSKLLCGWDTMHFSMVDTIEQNVEQVTINVDEGNRQLEKGVMYKVRERERDYCALHLNFDQLLSTL